ncbi:hypothetical protein T439DRAFT_382973 [Meredithblackwellia eburnea MCA 4105]
MSSNRPYSSRFTAVASDSDSSDNDAAPPFTSSRPPSYRTTEGNVRGFKGDNEDGVTSASDNSWDDGVGKQARYDGSPEKGAEEDSANNSGDTPSAPPLVEDKAPKSKPEGDAMDRFFEEIKATEDDLDDLAHHFDQIRALSAELRFLPLNDFGVPEQAERLRDDLKVASQKLTDIDGEIQLHWDDENEVRDAVARGQIVLTEEENYDRRRGYDKVAAKFIARVNEIKREAKGEKKERDKKGTIEPDGLHDWLAAGANDPMVLSKHDKNPPSRYVVLNPFSILASLTEGMQSLVVHNMLPPGSNPPPKRTITLPPAPTKAVKVQTEQQAMAKFYEDISKIHIEVDYISDGFHHLRMITAKITNKEVEASAPNIQQALFKCVKASSILICDVDTNIEDHWDTERRITTTGSAFAVDYTSENVYERRHEYDAVVSRFLKRVQVIQTQVKFEAKQRRRNGGQEIPSDFDKFLRGEEAVASREANRITKFTSQNPFTTLAIQINKIKPLIQLDNHASDLPLHKMGFATWLQAKESAMPCDPTPAGPGGIRRLMPWKKTSSSSPDLEKADDTEKPEEKKYRVWGTKERWVVFLSLAFIPALLAAVLIFTTFGKYNSGHSVEVYNFTTTLPSMIPDSNSSSITAAVPGAEVAR